ncbi:MAG: NAD(P)/FAD-dependent oxidoreductase [Candidatus Electrothrix sp. LOE2]|nr:NAD(P)/FAD-dependent oxidoreductase [Candidatus Electrothrix sp. LOE2]
MFPMNDNKKIYDIIIIGGGLGGLTAGAKLTKDGYKVLLIERNHKPGGCATTFKRKDYTMEVSLHALDGLDINDPKRKLFEDLGIFEHVEFVSTPEFYRIKNKRIDISIPNSKDEAIRLLIKKFPDEARGIRFFFRTTDAIRLEYNRLPLVRWKIYLLLPFFPILFPNLVFNTFKTLGRLLDDQITNEDLKIILAGNVLYYHNDPLTMSLIYFCTAQANFYNGGTYYIKGGSQKLSDYLAKVITDNNGKILFNHQVETILTKKGRAVGVQYSSLLLKTPEKIYAQAKMIIANTAIPNVAAMLHGKEQRRLKQKIQHLRTSCSIISVYIGFKSNLQSLGNKHCTTFILDDCIKELSDMKKNFRDVFTRRSFFFTDYGQIDSGLSPENKAVGTVSAPDYFTDWENLSKEEYQKKKEEVARIIFRRLENIIPGITNEIDCYEVGTPKTIQRQTLNPDGVAYGFSQLPLQAGLFRLPSKSPVKNLYFASAWASPGGGFTGAMLSGWLCAHEVTGALKPSFSFLTKKIF